MTANLVQSQQLTARPSTSKNAINGLPTTTNPNTAPPMTNQNTNLTSTQPQQPVNPEKLKIAELKDWLKNHNVPYRNSWKRLQLVQKVKDAIASGIQPPLPARNTKYSCKLTYPAAGSGWGKSLSNVYVTTKMVDQYVAQHNTSTFRREDLTAPSVKLRAFKFAAEGYCINILINNTNGTIFCTSRFHSFKKNERPHVVKCALRNRQVIHGQCSWSAGEGGHCNHVLALLYTLCTMTDNKLTSVPDDITCTSMLQKWQKPRGNKIEPEAVDQVVVKKIKMQDGSAATRTTRGIKSTLYKAATVPLLHDQQLIRQSISKLQTINPRIPAAYMLKPSSDTTTHTKTIFGAVEKGSLLSYQYATKSPVDLPTVSNIPVVSGCGRRPAQQPVLYPRFPLDIVPPYASSEANIADDIDGQCGTFLQSLLLTDIEASSLEEATRKQSESDAWQKARQHRLTASTFGKIKCAMAKKGSKGKEKIVRNKLDPTPPSQFVQEMLNYGLQMEPVVADRYSSYMQSIGHKVEIFQSGVVINENNLWLAATPDCKVIDMCEDHPYGLLEIKAPAHAKYKHVTPLEACNAPTYFQENINGFPQLKKANERGYYEQAQGQMALTGAKWCDFVVCTDKGMSVERIRFDKQFWLGTVKPLEDFYFQYFIPGVLSKRTQ